LNGGIIAESLITQKIKENRQHFSRSTSLDSFNDTLQNLYYSCDDSYTITNDELGETLICRWLFKAQCPSFLRETKTSRQA
jgi:hypothetical protein